MPAADALSGAAGDAVLDLHQPCRVHLVGIGGAGLSAMAAVLVAMGHAVTGSDLKQSPATDQVAALGVPVAIGHRPENVGTAQVVAVSTAVPPGNAEVEEARRRGLPVLSRADLLAAICATRRTVAVSGTHGKTTTSSMLALILVEAGLRPSFIIGGQVNEVGSGAAWDDGDWFVVEADESDGTFLRLGAEMAVVTAVEADHLDQWGSLTALTDAFAGFVASVPGPVIGCADDPVAARLAREVGGVTYGFAAGADFRIVGYAGDRDSCRFLIEHDGEVLGRLELPVPGAHNARNATAAVAAAAALGAPFDAAARALQRFGGVSRRFQFRGERAGITLVDDYAHNPGKVRAVLAAARQGGWDRVVAVFQPHLYSRTADLAGEFGASFDDADVVVVTDIFGAREEPRPGVTGKLIVDAICDHNPGCRVVWLPDRTSLAADVARLLRPGDLCLTIGAGDITALPDELLGMTEVLDG